MKALGLNRLPELWERINKLIDCKRPIVWLEGRGSVPSIQSGNYAEQAMEYVTCDTSPMKVKAMVMSGTIPRFFIKMYDPDYLTKFRVYELTPELICDVDIYGNEAFDKLRLTNTDHYDIGMSNMEIILDEWNYWSGLIMNYNLSCAACEQDN